jgi:hypothetical protein
MGPLLARWLIPLFSTIADSKRVHLYPNEPPRLIADIIILLFLTITGCKWIYPYLTTSLLDSSFILLLLTLPGSKSTYSYLNESLLDWWLILLFLTITVCMWTPYLDRPLDWQLISVFYFLFFFTVAACKWTHLYFNTSFLYWWLILLLLTIAESK